MRIIFLLLPILTLVLSCGVYKYLKRAPKTYEKRQETSGNVQVGLASWYGIEEHNNRAASGERFDKNELTAAHKTLAMDSIVRVTNLENGRDVIVRINDRGPFVAGRIIDLSYAAAKEVDLLGPGTARVKVEVLSTPNRSDNYFKGKYIIQVGSFKNRNNAYNLKNKLSAKFDNVEVYEYSKKNEKFHRVRLVGYDTKNDAEGEFIKLRKMGYKPRIKLE
jgi:rare lipoprotein A